MKGFVPERARNGELPAVDYGTRCGRGQGGDMAAVTANLGEECFPSLGLGSRRLLSVARRSLGGAQKTRKVINVGETIRSRFVVGLGDGIAQVRYFIGKKRVRDAHFIQVGIARKR